MTEPYSLDLELDIVSSYNPGYRATHTDPGEGPSAVVEIRRVFYRRRDGVLVELTLPPDVLQDMASAIEDDICETEAS